VDIEQFLAENPLFIESDVNFLVNSVFGSDFIENWSKNLRLIKFQENYGFSEAI